MVFHGANTFSMSLDIGLGLAQAHEALLLTERA